MAARRFICEDRAASRDVCLVFRVRLALPFVDFHAFSRSLSQLCCRCATVQTCRPRLLVGMVAIYVVCRMSNLRCAAECHYGAAVTSDVTTRQTDRV